MLREWGCGREVAYGASSSARRTPATGIRAYKDLGSTSTDRQDAFYGSEEWRNGPREAIVSRIESYSRHGALDAARGHRGSAPPQRQG